MQFFKKLNTYLFLSVTTFLISTSSYAQTHPQMSVFNAHPSLSKNIYKIHLSSTSINTPIHLENGQQPCWDAAAKYEHLDPWLLYAVAYVESHHNPYAISKNRNGSYDIGLMQINSSWLPELYRDGITQKTLSNACASTFVGAWVLAKGIRHYGYSWKAIASYNVGNVEDPRRRQIGLNYAKKVYAAYHKLSAMHAH